VDGVPVGRTLRPPPPPSPEGADAGSCIGIVATDAPCSPPQLERLARRVGLGLARAGSVARHGSGEIFAAFSTAARAGMRSVDDAGLNPMFSAVVEASEEAVINSLFAADTVSGAHGHTVHGLPLDEVQALLRGAGRLRDEVN
jgi:D-aminopeptidase